MKKQCWLWATIFFVGMAAGACAQQIPPSFWGLHTNNESNFPLLVENSSGDGQYGAWRAWDADIQWDDIQSTCPSGDNCVTTPWDQVPDYTLLDTTLAALKSQGVSTVLYTLSRTPAWASSYPTDPYCISGYGAGSCDPPADLCTTLSNNVCTGASGPNKVWMTKTAQKCGSLKCDSGIPKIFLDNGIIPVLVSYRYS